MSKRRIFLSVCALMFLGLAGCAVQSAQRHSILPLQFEFSRGGSAQYFYLKKALRPVSGSASPTQTYLFVVGGADCASFSRFLPRYFNGLEGESGDTHIFVLQKRFITSRSFGAPCSERFVNADHPSQWIADQQEFIQKKIAEIPPYLRVRIALLGISEGAEIAPILAKNIGAITHLVLLSNGGLSPLDALRLQRKKNKGVMPIDVANLDKQKPPRKSRVLGRSWIYWNEISGIQQLDNLLALDIPIFIAMGAADPIVPAESAVYAQQEFAARHLNNLKVVLYPSANHYLETEGVTYMPDFFHKMDLWLGE